MFDWFKTFLRHCLTGVDNATYDVARVGGALAIVGHVGMSTAHLVLHGVFDPMNFGAGAATILASIGAAVGLKAKSEPGAPGSGSDRPGA